MKLCRIGSVGEEKPAIIDSENNYRDLSSIINDFNPDTLNFDTLEKLKKTDISSLPKLDSSSRIGACVSNPAKFIGIGLNFKDHAEEQNLPIPKEPIIFSKFTSCITGPNDPIIVPKGSNHTDWEVELGVVIGRAAKYVDENNALDYVAGYCLVNDVTERKFQSKLSGQWTKGKSCDTFGPIGPWMVTKDEIGDPQNLDMWLDVNGQRMQTGNTKTMIFNVKQIVSHLSQLFTLYPGDIISTGTPPGVGMGMKPNPIFLKDGDIMTLHVDGLGQQTQKVKFE